jgi:hypothetical protein
VRAAIRQRDDVVQSPGMGLWRKLGDDGLRRAAYRGG